MKILLSICMLLFSFSALTWEAQEQWSNDLSQELLLNCDSQEKLCQDTCNEAYQCYVPLNPCKNCIGTGILMSYFYQEVGKWFTNSGSLISDEHFYEMLKSRDIVLLTHNSPYNIFTPVNDMSIERAFSSLCPEKFDSYPVVIGELDQNAELRRIAAVICHGRMGAKVFKINTKPQVEINLKHMLQMRDLH